MDNPKTTVIGYIMISVVVIYMGYGFYSGKPMDMQDVLAALVGIGGAGLVVAADSKK